MKIGYHAPLPPARTGVAQYAAALLGALRRHADLEPGAGEADVHLYQVGNNQAHAEIYDRALRQPGVILLHDAVLHHLLLGRLGEQQYIEEFTYNYGAWSRGLAEELWRSRARSAAEPRYFEHPLIKRIVEISLAVIVHNARAEQMVLEHAPGAHVHRIPHLFDGVAPPPVYDTVRLRASIGLSPSDCLFAVMGHLRESKRLLPVLRAFAAVHRALPRTALLVAGSFVSEHLELAARPLLEQPGVLRRGYVPDAEFWRLAAAVDVVLNLRYPSAGETSGIGVRLMGLGKAVVFTEGAETSDYPPGACIRIDAGPGEERTLHDVMAWLAEFPEHRRRIGRFAALHIARRHAPDVVAPQVLGLLQRYAARPAQAPRVSR